MKGHKQGLDQAVVGGAFSQGIEVKASLLVWANLAAQGMIAPTQKTSDVAVEGDAAHTSVQTVWATEGEVVSHYDAMLGFARQQFNGAKYFQPEDVVQEAFSAMTKSGFKGIKSPCLAYVRTAVMHSGLSLKRKFETQGRGAGAAHVDLEFCCVASPSGESDLYELIALTERFNQIARAADPSITAPRLKIALRLMVAWAPDDVPSEEILPSLTDEEFELFLPSDWSSSEEADSGKEVKAAVGKSIWWVRKLLRRYKDKIINGSSAEAGNGN